MALLRLNTEDFEIEPMRVHSLPCKIHHDGPAPVSEYFRCENLQATRQDSHIPDQHDVSVATFRGRKLLGREEKLPEGMFGLICRETGEEEEEATGSRILQVESNFDSITYWKQDAVPRRDEDSVPVWLDFMRLSRVLHGVDQ